MKKLILILLIFVYGCADDYDWQNINNTILYIDDSGVSARYELKGDSLTLNVANLTNTYYCLTVDENQHEGRGNEVSIDIGNSEIISFYISGKKGNDIVIINTRRRR